MENQKQTEISEKDQQDRDREAREVVNKILKDFFEKFRVADAQHKGCGLFLS